MTNSIVYVVDDDPSVRDSLTWLLESVGQQVMSFASPDDFLSGYKVGHFGCLILDVRMPGISGLELQEQLTVEGFNLPIIIITGHADVPMAIRALKAGAFDFIEKPFNDQDLIERIQRAIELSQNMVEHDQRVSAVKQRLSQLTDREMQVLNAVLEGKSNKLIAREFNLSVKTVEVHRSKLMTKMQAGSLSELVRQSILAKGTVF